MTGTGEIVFFHVDQIKIKFHEATSGWEVEATFSPNEVYEQVRVGPQSLVSNEKHHWYYLFPDSGHF